MKYCHIDINFTTGKEADCRIASVFDNGEERKVGKRCRLDVDGIRTLDGAAPFECMDDVDVRLSEENWAVVDAL